VLVERLYSGIVALADVDDRHLKDSPAISCRIHEQDIMRRTPESMSESNEFRGTMRIEIRLTPIGSAEKQVVVAVGHLEAMRRRKEDWKKAMSYEDLEKARAKHAAKDEATLK
jgi:hypothetical protein